MGVPLPAPPGLVISSPRRRSSNRNNHPIVLTTRSFAFRFAQEVAIEEVAGWAEARKYEAVHVIRVHDGNWTTVEAFFAIEVQLLRACVGSRAAGGRGGVSHRALVP